MRQLLRHTRASCVVGATLLTLWIGSATAAAPPRRCVAVVGTNDVHGALEPQRFSVGDDPAATVRGGGVTVQAAYIAALRQKYGERLVVVDAGDMFQGSLASNLSLGKAMIDAYNLIGYSAAAVGNHEFDFGATPGSTDRLSVLKARIAEARFPFLTLNIFDTHTGNRVDWPNTRPSVLVQAGDVQVGILGISTVDTPRVTKAENITGLEFVDPVPLIVREAAALRRAGAEIVVLVGHVGGKCTDLSDPNRLASCAERGTDAELLEILRALPQGTLDIAVGGHTHQFVAHWVNGVATLESGYRGNYLGYVEACVDAKGGIDQAASTIHGAVPLCVEAWADGTCKKRRKPLLPVAQSRFLDQPMAPLGALERAMQPYLDAVTEMGTRPLGVRLPQALAVGPLTDLVAEAMRRVVNADFGLQNRGGVRGDLPAGALTFGQVFGVLPFDNDVVKVHLTGEQIQRLVTLLSRRRTSYGSPVLVGLKALRRGSELQVVTAKGRPLDPDRRYSFSTSDFLLQGGEGADVIFRELTPSDIEVSGVSMRDAFIRLVKSLYPAPSAQKHASWLRSP